MVCSSLYPLSTENEGTLIGSLATGKNGINDVGMDVSRNHLRIFTRDNVWFAQDLGSTNGSQLISGADKSTTAIGPKDNGRSREPSTPAKIEHGDILRLGATTQFLVLRIAETA